MAIDKIGNVNNYNEYNKINKTSKSNSKNALDTVSISTEATSLAENKRILDIVKSAPDVRADKVAEIKEKLKNPDYINGKVIDSLADEILKSIGF